MKLRTAIWTIVILCCVGLGIWQRNNLSIIWREYSSLHRHFEYERGLDRLCKPVIGKRIARTDPEAAAIAESMLCGYVHTRSEQHIDILARNVAKYPGNEFFAYNLACSFNSDSVIDPQIILLLANRLIKLDRENVNYHYLKAYALLRDRTTNDIDAVLEEIEHASKCSKYIFPYSYYRQRVLDIANKAKLSQVLMGIFSAPWQLNPFVYDLRKHLISQTHLALTDGDHTGGIYISDVWTEMLKRQIAGKDRRIPLIIGLRGFSPPGFGYWDVPQLLELQRATLSRERARQNRLELCALMSPVKESKKEYKKEIPEVAYDRAVFKVPPITYIGGMFVAFGIVWLILLVASLIRGFGGRPKVRFTVVILFIAGCGYHFLARGYFLQQFYGDYYYHFSGVLRPSPIGLGDILEYITYDFEDASRVLTFLAGPIVVTLVLWAVSFLRPEKGAFWKLWYLKALVSFGIGAILASLASLVLTLTNSPPWQGILVLFGLVSAIVWILIMFGWWLFRNRLVRVVLVATFLAVLTVLASGYHYISYLPMVLFIITSAIIVTSKPAEKILFFKTLFGLFSKKQPFAQVRRRCVNLTGPFIVVYWVLFISLVPSFAQPIKWGWEGLKLYDTYDYRYSFPEANEVTYQQVLKRFDKEELTKQKVHRLIGLVMPEDLPDVLKKLKIKEFTDPYAPIMGWPRSPKDEEKARLRMERVKKLNDWDLILAMRHCGRDVVSIITEFMDNPELERALVARGKLADITAKEKLEKLWQVLMQRQQGQEEEADYKFYWERPAETGEIVGALACVSEPDEAVQWFIDYIEKRKASDLIRDNDVFDSVTLLPSEQARKVIKAYLAKTSGLDLYDSPYEVLSPLRKLVGFYGDRQIAEDVFKIMLSAVSKGEQFEPFDISPYFENELAELLKKGLSSENEDMRAWCLWQLRRIGYAFDETELNELLRDESWKVRANAMLAGGKGIIVLAARDRSDFVKLVGSFLTESRH